MIHAHNSNSRPVVAWVVETHGTKTPAFEHVGGDGMKMDSFFWDDDRIMAQGYDFTTSVECNQFRATDDATIRATFVQFDDGSLWGDPKEGRGFAIRRQDAIDYMKEIQSAPDLKKAVSKMPVYDAKGNLAGAGRHLEWFRFSQLETSDEIAAEIDKRLAIGERHKAWLDATKVAAQIAEAKKPPEYVIKVSDTLVVIVINRRDLNKRQPVRDDGKISLPLLNDVQAAGLTPRQLAASIREKLKNHIGDPDGVTVVVDGMDSPQGFAHVPERQE